MPEYRTDAEWNAQTEQEERVRAVLDQAVRDGGSLLVAMELGEPQDVVELWVDRVWNGLRDNLRDDQPAPHPELRDRPDEDRLCAIAILLRDRMNAEREAIFAAIEEATGA